MRNWALAGVFAFSTAQILMIALFPVLAETLGLSLSTLIGCFSLGSFLFVVGSPYWAKQSDIRGRVPILKTGLAALAISFAAIAFLVRWPFENSLMNLAIVLCSRILYGLVASAVVPVAQSMQADLAGDQGQARAMLTHSMSLSLGRVFGVALIVLFGVAFREILFAILAMLILTFLAGMVLPKSALSPVQVSNESAGATWLGELQSVKWIVAIAFIFTCFMEALNSSLGGTLKHLFEMSSLQASQLTATVLLVAGIGIFAVQALARAFVRRSSNLIPTLGVWTLLVGALQFWKVNSIQDLWIAIGFFVVGIGLIPPFYLSLLRAGASTDRYGRRAGLIGSAHTLGYAFGSAVAAVTLRQQGQIGLALGAMAVILAFAFVLQMKKPAPVLNRGVS